MLNLYRKQVCIKVQGKTLLLEGDQKIQRGSIDRDSNTRPTPPLTIWITWICSETIPNLAIQVGTKVSSSLFCIILRLFRISTTSKFNVQILMYYSATDQFWKMEVMEASASNGNRNELIEGVMLILSIFFSMKLEHKISLSFSEMQILKPIVEKFEFVYKWVI